jgi:D-proline reductase (dithiol) PrdB
MARLEQVHPAMRASLLAMECPTFDTHPWVAGPALRQRRVALISTAGLHRRDDRPFAVASGNARAMAGDYRVIPPDIAANDLVMNHVSTNFDRVCQGLGRPETASPSGWSSKGNHCFAVLGRRTHLPARRQ